MRALRVVFLLILILTIAALGFWSKKDALILRASTRALQELTHVPISSTGVHLDLSGRKIRFENVKIGAAENDSAHAEFVEIAFDLANLYERRIDIPLIRIVGLELNNNGADGVLFRFIKPFTKKSKSPAKIDISAGELRVEESHTGYFHFEKNTVSFTPKTLTFNFRKDHEQVFAEGEISLTNELPPALKALHSFTGTAKIEGKLNAPSVDLQLHQNEPGAVGLSIESSLREGVLTIVPHVDSPQAKVRGQIEVLLAGLTVRARDFSVESFPLQIVSESIPNAELSLSANGEFSFARLSGQLTSQLQVTKLSQFGIESARAELSFSENGFHIQNGALSGPGGEIAVNADAAPDLREIEGTVSTSGFLLRQKQNEQLTKSFVRAGGELRLIGSLDAMNVTGLIAATYSRQRLGEREEELFTLPVRISLSGSAKEPQSMHGDIECSPFSIREGDLDIRTESAATLSLENLALQIQPLEIIVGNQKVNLSGNIGKEGYGVSLNGGADVGALVGDIPGIDELKGRAELELQLSGALNEPKLNGKIHLLDGSLSVETGDENVTISNIEGPILFDESALSVGPIQSGSTDPALHIEGRINNFLSTADRSGELYIEVENLTAQPRAGLTVRAHSELKLSVQPATRPKLAGDVVLDEVLYEQKSDLNTLLRDFLDFFRSGKGSIEERSRPAAQLPLDFAVNIRGERTIVVDTDFLQAEFQSDLRLESIEKEPRLTGDISTDSGELNLSKTQLTISRAALHFHQTPIGASPSVELRAEGELGASGAEELVQLEIIGELPNPDVKLRSESGRSDRELLGLLGLGVDKLSIVRQSDRKLTVGEILNPFSGASLTDRFTGLTGVTNVGIESGYSADTGEFTPQVLMERPLPLGFGLIGRSDLSQANRSEVDAEYSLTDQTKFFTGWKNAPTTQNPDSLAGSFGAGLHYRERFGGVSLFPGELLLENLKGLIP